MAVRIRCGICVVQVSVTRPVDSVIGGVAGARLHRRGVLPARARLDLDDLVRAFPDSVEAGGLELAFDDDIAGRLGVHLRRAGGEAPRSASTTRRCAFDDQLRLCSAMSSASSSLAATTAATGSPTKRTTPSASTGWPTGL